MAGAGAEPGTVPNREAVRRGGPPPWLPPFPVLAAWAATRAVLFVSLTGLVNSGDGVMDLTHGWVAQMLAGNSPYSPRGVAYPPLAMLTFVPPGLGGVGAGVYRFTFPLLVLAADLGGLAWAWSAERRGRRFASIAYTLAVPAVGPILLLWRYDLLPAVCHLAALVFALRGRRRASWLWLGVGIAFKPYLLAVVPLWVAWDLRSREPGALRRLASGAAAGAAPSVVAALAMLPFSGWDFLTAYGTQVTRGLQIESTPALVLGELGRHGWRQQSVFSDSCLCWERTGSSASALSTASTIFVLVALVAVVVWYWRRAAGRPPVAASVAAILVLLVGFRVFSPQYLLWPVPPLALLAWRARGTISLGLVAVAGLLAASAYPGNYASVIVWQDPGRLLLILRTLACIAALGVVLPEVETEPASGDARRSRSGRPRPDRARPSSHPPSSAPVPPTPYGKWPSPGD